MENARKTGLGEPNVEEVLRGLVKQRWAPRRIFFEIVFSNLRCGTNRKRSHHSRPVPALMASNSSAAAGR